MPLFHVGGIMRSTLAPALSGGAVVAMRHVDADAFWRNVVAFSATWYYSSPTIHRAYFHAHVRASADATTLRLVANAAGPLAPEMATQMRDTYSPRRARGASSCPRTA